MKKIKFGIIVLIFMSIALNVLIFAEENIVIKTNIENVTATQTDQFEISILAENIEDLYAFEISVEYDSSKITYLRTDFDDLSGVHYENVIKEENFLYCVYTKIGNEITQSGDIVLCTLTFRGDEVNKSDINIKQLKLVKKNSNGQLTKEEYSINSVVNVEILKGTDEFITEESTNQLIVDITSFEDELIPESNILTLENVKELAPILIEGVIASIKGEGESADQLEEVVNESLTQIYLAAQIMENDDDIVELNDVLVQIVDEIANNLDEDINVKFSASALDSVRKILIMSESIMSFVETSEAVNSMVVSMIDACEPILLKVDYLGGRTRKLTQQMNCFIQQGINILVSSEILSENVIWSEQLIESIEKTSGLSEDYISLLNDKGIDIKFVKKLRVKVSETESNDYKVVKIPYETINSSLAYGFHEIQLVTEFGLIIVPVESVANMNETEILQLEWKTTNKSSDPMGDLNFDQSKFLELGIGLYEIKASFINSGDKLTTLSLVDNIQIELNVLPDSYSDWNQLRIGYLPEEGGEKYIIGEYDEDTGTISFSINEFGKFGLEESVKTFDDVPKNYWGSMYIESLASKGIISGKTENIYEPNSYVTRAEFAKLISLAAGVSDNHDIETYSDVTNDKWYYHYIISASQAGFLNGYPDGTFRPGEKITREQIAVIIARCLKEETPTELLRFLNYSDKNDISTYALDGMALVIKDCIIEGKNEFLLDPKGYATRGEVAAIIYRYLDY